MHLIPYLAFLPVVLTLPLQTRDGSGAVTSKTGLSFYDANYNSGSGYTSHSNYTCYRGLASNFPPPSKWASFNNLFPFQKSNALLPIGDSNAEAQAIYNAILSISKTAKVDARVILAVIIQESTGNVRVSCTFNGIQNCGIMQSYNPANKTYDPKNMQASITQMVRDGTQGTATGPGLVQYMNDAADTGVKTGGNLWLALRGYNSGSINATDLSNGMGATSSYVSDVANYLQGWQGWGSPVRNTCGF